MRALFLLTFDLSARGYSRWRQLLTITVYSRLLRGVGWRSVIHPFYLLRNPQYIRIGSRTLIRKSCRFEVVLHGQDWEPSLEIGNNVNIEQNVHIICHGRVVIEDDVSITGNCAIVDVTHPFDAVLDGAKIGNTIDERFSEVRIGRGSFIGYGSIILPNVTIGRGCVIGAGSVVDRDVPDLSIAAGAPARVIRPIARDLGTGAAT